MSRYRTFGTGERINVRGRKFKFMCCDCGLVHTLLFRLDGRRITFQVDRDNRATANARRRNHPLLKGHKGGP